MSKSKRPKRLDPQSEKNQSILDRIAEVLLRASEASERWLGKDNPEEPPAPPPDKDEEKPDASD